MIAAADPLDDIPKKKSKLPLLLGFVLSLVGGAGGFYAVKSGLLFSANSGESDVVAGQGSTELHIKDSARDKVPMNDVSDMAFVPIEPLVISIQDPTRARFLRFSAQLEVNQTYELEVQQVMPRIVDILNGYLRAVDLKELSDPNILMRLRSQLLRRIQVVTGKDHVRDLLIIEFVLN